MLSDGAYDRIASRLHFDVLAVVFFGLVGGIGAVKCLVVSAPEMNLYFALFALSGGVGLLCGRVVSISIRKWRGSVQPVARAERQAAVPLDTRYGLRAGARSALS